MSLDWHDWKVAHGYAHGIVNSVDASYASSLVWRLRDLELVGPGIRGRTVLDLEDEVTASALGVAITWSELIDMLATAEDVRELLVTGHRTQAEADIPLDHAFTSCVAVIEVLDSTTRRIGWAAPGPTAVP